MEKEKFNAAEYVVNQILDMLDKGVSPWHKPWNCYGVPQSINGNKYRGINAILLAMLPYKSPYYVTFNKCGEMGGTVKKGEKGHIVVFYKWILKKIVNEDGEEETKSFPYLQFYRVWNVEQCEGLPAKYYEVKERNHNDIIAEAEAIWDCYKDKPVLKHNPKRSYYSVSDDYISIPEINEFDNAEAYYSTLFHEASHSTGSKNRLDRLSTAGFGTEEYGKEELVAEISSQILCQIAGITKTLPNSASYCENWARVIRSTKAQAFVNACASANNASDYILGIGRDEEDK